MALRTNLVFLDTSFFKALLDELDDFHLRSLAVLESIGRNESKMVTSNFIIDESFTLIRQRRGIELARKLFSFFEQEGKNIEVVRVLVEDEQGVWDWFWNDWSKLSFTDCTSFAVMKRLGISQVATFDKHFQQAGFEVV